MAARVYSRQRADARSAHSYATCAGAERLMRRESVTLASATSISLPMCFHPKFSRVTSGNFFFFAADDERKGVLVTELPREDLLRSSRTIRRRTITVEAPHRRAGEEKRRTATPRANRKSRWEVTCTPWQRRKLLRRRRRRNNHHDSWVRLISNRGSCDRRSTPSLFPFRETT